MCGRPATWSGALTGLDESRIAIEISHATLAACEPGALDRTFLRDLAAVSTYMLRGGRLHLELPYDTGTMTFDR